MGEYKRDDERKIATYLISDIHHALGVMLSTHADMGDCCSPPDVKRHAAV